jgi:SAM-dependent methyltransferase
MKPETIAKLHQINQEFYQTFAASFASTRRRIQHGIRQILREIPSHGNWLDIGCGSGALAAEWVQQQRTGRYHGIDFSQDLLNEAEKEIQAVQVPAGLKINFTTADLISESWNAPLIKTGWNGALCFAVLHHIPGSDLRQKICASIAELLGKQKDLYLSVWQVQNSPRLMQRVLPWSQAELNEGDLEKGDVLMDWRAGPEGDSKSRGVRYVHIFSKDELGALAESSGFNVTKSFYSDGKEGSLGLYQCWVVK